jgi:hypothetical protein
LANTFNEKVLGLKYFKEAVFYKGHNRLKKIGSSEDITYNKIIGLITGVILCDRTIRFVNSREEITFWHQKKLFIDRKQRECYETRYLYIYVL